MYEEEFSSRLLRRQVFTARKAYECLECGRTINPGERYMRHVGLIDGDFTTYATHPNNCSMNIFPDEV